MIRRWVVFAGLGILLFASLIFMIWPPAQKPEVEFDLADGTSIQLLAVSQGKMLKFYEGTHLQKSLFSICGANLPERFRGYESYIAPLNTNGALGLKFRHFRKNSDLPLPVMMLGGPVEVAASGDKPVRIQPQGSFTSPVGTNAQPSIEDLIWEYPISNERELHFQFYQANEQGLVFSTNEFTIPNPAFK
jgi:hypothetical protein